MNIDTSLGWLAAMIDGEGNVCFLKNPLCREIIISNTDEDIVDALKSTLEKLGVHFTVSVEMPRGECQKKCYRVSLATQDALVFIYENCPIQSKRKQEKLLDILLSYKRRPYKRTTQTYTEVTL